METRLVRVNTEEQGWQRELLPAAEILREGGLVAFPTETVYGLGANAWDPEAAKKIYAAKGRPSDNPLIVHICEREQLADLAADVPPMASVLMDRFWPGPLTLIFRKKPEVPKETTGGLDTVAVRMPSHPVAAELIRRSGVPITAPSANASGRPSPTRALHVLEDMDGRIPLILDGGEVGIGLESTIIDCTGERPVMLRPGYVTREDVAALLGELETDPAVYRKMGEGEAPKAPGMKYRHYAPKASMILLEGDPEKAAERICNLALERIRAGERPGILCASEHEAMFREKTGAVVECIGSREDPRALARNLYGCLRAFDSENVSVIYSEAFSSDGLGEAIMNRMLKAAGHRTEICG